MRARLIPLGEVDERDICEVKPEDIRGFGHCHFFAGIGGWALAAQLAGWPEDRPLWSASVPCQPFSIADNSWNRGKQLLDDRHLFPVFANLAGECGVSSIVGEQVANAIGKGWLDAACGAMEAQGYAFGSAVLPACGFGAEHERKRIVWGAHTGNPRQSGPFIKGRVPSVNGSSIAAAGDAFAHARDAMAGDFSHVLSRNGVSAGVERRLLRTYGNAIVPQVGAQWLRAFMEATK